MTWQSDSRSSYSSRGFWNNIYGICGPEKAFIFVKIRRMYSKVAVQLRFISWRHEHIRETQLLNKYLELNSLFLAWFSFFSFLFFFQNSLDFFQTFLKFFLRWRRGRRWVRIRRSWRWTWRTISTSTLLRFATLCLWTTAKTWRSWWSRIQFLQGWTTCDCNNFSDQIRLQCWSQKGPNMTAMIITMKT